HDLHHRTPPDPVERLRRDPARRRRPSDDRRPDRRSGRDRAAQRGVGTYAPAGDRPDSAALTMSTRVCLSASTLNYPRGGGHMWVYLNWALGLRSVGCEVFWLEGVVKGGWVPGGEGVADRLAALKARLSPYGLSERVAVWSGDGIDPESG